MRFCSQESSDSAAVNPGPSRRAMRQISLSSPSMLLASFISSSSGAVRRERHEMDEGQRNTMWPGRVAADDGMCSPSVYLLLSSVSLALHSSIKTGEKNGCNLFLTLFLNTSLHHLHRPDRTLISHLQKPGENETNCDPPSSSGTERSSDSSDICCTKYTVKYIFCYIYERENSLYYTMYTY